MLNIKPETYKILNERAQKRGFSNVEEALAFVESGELQALYVIVKDFSLEDLYKGINKLLVEKKNDLDYWYNKSWTKTIVLAGNPKKLKNKFQFVYSSDNIGLIGPVFQKNKVANELINLLIPLRSKKLDLTKFTSNDNNNFKFIFNNIDLSLGKFIVQLVHMLAEIGLEQNGLVTLPSIEVSGKSNLEKTDYTYKYLRIDGGFTEVDPFTHIATGVIL